jgi:hypothetical protein
MGPTQDLNKDTQFYFCLCFYFKILLSLTFKVFFLFLLADTNIHSGDQISNELIKNLFLSVSC